MQIHVRSTCSTWKLNVRVRLVHKSPYAFYFFCIFPQRKCNKHKTNQMRIFFLRSTKKNVMKIGATSRFQMTQVLCHCHCIWYFNAKKWSRKAQINNITNMRNANCDAIEMMKCECILNFMTTLVITVECKRGVAVGSFVFS